MGMEEIKQLRELTGAGMGDCKKALDASENDVTKAVDWLRAKGIAAAAKKATRAATEGLVGTYVHAGGKIGVLIEVNCETDFVALNDGFQGLVRDLAMHIAASNPLWVAKEDVPADAIERERQVQIQRTMEEGKPQAIAEKMVEGRMKKFYQDVCLLEQEFFKDDSKTVGQVVTDAIARIGENIKVRRFARFALGEGLEKKTSNLADEVAATLAG
jgi:elongation factor Ts